MEKDKYKLLGDNLDQDIKIVKIEKRTGYNISEVHRHNYNEMFFFIKGEGNHIIDFTNHQINDFSIHCVISNKVHQVNRSNDSFGFVLLFKNEFLYSDILKQHYLFLDDSEVFNLVENDFKEFIAIIKNIDQELNKNTFLSYQIVETFLHLILTKLKQHLEVYSDNYSKSLFFDESLYKSFYLLVESNFLNERKTTFYSKKLGITSIKLNAEMQKITGKTASTLIQDRLILEAKRLLFHSKLSVKEIAYHLNFNDTAHFSKFFKVRVGMTPSEFRQTRSTTDL